MNEECVVAVFDNLEHAQGAVHVLDRGEFPTGQVSLVAKGLRELPEIVEDLEMEDDSAYDAAVGAGLGAIVGVLAGIAVMVVSGLGAVFLVGPIGGGIGGAVAGAFLGGLSGWGVHEEHIRHYEGLIKEGKVLVIAHGNPLELIHADRILKEMAPTELHVYAKTSSEAPEIQDL
jgi:hypothetical protein